MDSNFKKIDSKLNLLINSKDKSKKEINDIKLNWVYELDKQCINPYDVFDKKTPYNI